MITIKWPRLLVVGEPITEEQADEVLLRTDSWYFGCNDRAWNGTLVRVCGEFGRPSEPSRTVQDGGGWAGYFEADRAWQGRLGILDLNYLHNSRIASSWIGGPHGWCDWTGAIGCSTFNIGKWPSDDEVTEDWTAIAEAFPFLDLHAQLLNHDEEGGDGSIAGHWRVKDGKVAHTDRPDGLLRQAEDIPEDAVMRMLTGLRTERGVTEERFRGALGRLIGAVESTGADT